MSRWRTSASSAPRAGRNRRGSALAIALVTLVLIAALAGGATIASRQSQRTARGDLARLHASAAAEGLLVAAMHPWDRRRNQLAPGVSDSTGVDSITGAAARLRIARLDADRFLLESAALASAAEPGAGGFAENTVSLLVRLVRPAATTLAALTVGGGLALLGGATADGGDAPPPGWSAADCPAPRADTAAILASTVTAVTVSPGAIVRGALRSGVAAADTLTYGRFGPDTWATLAARADVQVDGAAGDRAPRPNANVNGIDCALGTDAWSEPTHDATGAGACNATYALVHARNDLVVRGPSRAQGMLLVDGDLTVDGDVAIAGVVVVRGSLHAQTAQLRVYGALLVYGSATLGAGSDVRWSRCAVSRTLDGVARVVPFGRRARAEVTP